MGESIEDLIEGLRKRGDLRLFAYLVDDPSTYRATAYFGRGGLGECRVDGSDLRDVLTRLGQKLKEAEGAA